MSEGKSFSGISKTTFILGLVIAIMASSLLLTVLFLSELQKQRNAYSKLENDYESLESENNYLQNQLDTLETTYENYVSTHTHSNSEYDDAVFSFYYIKPEEQKFGVYELDNELYGLEWLHPYKEDEFDCSEMSAYLEWHLENEGWNVMILAGDSPFGSGKHAWLLVETSQGKYMPVESTNIQVVWWEDPNFDGYFTYDYSFDTIQEAIAYSESEFDWWDSP